VHCTINATAQQSEDFNLEKITMSDKNTDEAKDRVKKAVGEITGDEKLKQEGRVDKASAKVKDGVDKVKDTLQGKKS
jgi:uncharacterized protein YjbJ (UPF0337 family)